MRTEVCNLKAMARWMGELDDAEATLVTQSPQGLGLVPRELQAEEPAPNPCQGQKEQLWPRVSPRVLSTQRTFSGRQSRAQPLKTGFMADKAVSHTVIG